jgi:hypothetical protein
LNGLWNLTQNITERCKQKAMRVALLERVIASDKRQG